MNNPIAQRSMTAGPFLALTAIVLVVPLVLVLTYAFRSSSLAGVGPGPTFEQFQIVFESEGSLRLIARTAAIGLIVASIVTMLAAVFAYGATFRLSRRTALLALGIVLGAGIASWVVRIYAWGTILGTNGLVNGVLEGLGFVDQPLEFLFFGYFAVVVTMTYIYLPLAALIVYSAMQNIDPSSVEASRDLGAGRWRTLFRVVVPQIRRSLLAVLALIAVLACADYVTPGIVGGTRGQMVGQLIRDRAIEQADFPAAAALALGFLGALALLILALTAFWRLLRPIRRRTTVLVDRVGSGIGMRTPARFARMSLSRPAVLLLVVYLIVPTLVVLFFSFNQAPTLGLPWTGFTGRWYSSVTERAGFEEALVNSGRIALFAVAAAVLMGLPFAFALQRARGAWQRGLWLTAMLPFVVPGVLLGLGIITLASAAELPLGITMTTAAHILLTTPIVIFVLAARLEEMNPELTEAARDLGSSPLRAFRTITLPLILPSLIGAALICAAWSLDEIFVTTFSIGAETTLPVWLLGQARLGFDPGINALGVMLMSGTLLLFLLAATVMRRISTEAVAGG